MPAIITIDKNNHLKVIIDNCPPFDITIDINNVLRIIDLEQDYLILMDGCVISSIKSEINDKLPRVP